MRALIVEDDIEQSAVWTRALSSRGYQVSCERCALRGRSALLSATKIDLLLTDLNLLDGTSIGLVDFACVKFPDCAIVMVTGDTRFQFGELHGVVCGADRVLQKPVPLLDLMAIIDHQVRVKESRNMEAPQEFQRAG